MRRLITYVQRKLQELRNEWAAKFEATAQSVLKEGAAHAREAEMVAPRDNSRTELSKVRNCLNLFRE